MSAFEAAPTVAASDPPAVAVPDPPPGAASSAQAAWQPPLLWRALLLLARVVAPWFCRLRVIDEIPAELRGGPLILASNHIGTFDPIALAAACARRDLAPRILATGGLFRARVVGPALRHCGHIQVNRRDASAVEALTAATTAVQEGSVVAGYPEGRITLDPGMWPEQGRSGMARLALCTGVPVVPVSQWGAHEVMTWDAPRSMVGRLFVPVWRRPVVWVRFGAPVDLAGLTDDVPRHAVEATNRIMGAITDGLRPLRADEPVLPRFVDPYRPVSSARTFRGGAQASSRL
ncbi:MAG: lysophospholipid acyltransferase family protein [Micromonosporaceae bacterium]